MIVENLDRGTVLAESVEVAATAIERSKGLLGRECLDKGQGMLIRNASSLHTFFMRFPIDIVYADKQGKVLKSVAAVRPFRMVAAPLRSYYALELPSGAISGSGTRVGDRLGFKGEDEAG